MRIVLLDEPIEGVVAREDQLGRLEGQFVTSGDGEIWYRHSSDRRLWFAASSVGQFRDAALVWNSCSDVGVKTASDSDPLRVAGELQERLAGTGVLLDRPDNLWTILLEQVRDGLL